MVPLAKKFPPFTNAQLPPATLGSWSIYKVEVANVTSAYILKAVAFEADESCKYIPASPPADLKNKLEAAVISPVDVISPLEIVPTVRFLLASAILVPFTQ